MDGPITDVLEGKALEFKRQDIDIYSASWGPRDNGATTEAPGAASIRAIEKGVREVSQIDKSVREVSQCKKISGEEGH